MKNDSSDHEKVKLLSNSNLELPDFINQYKNNSEVCSIEGTNVIRVPFGIRLSKRKRPEKGQNIATLILPLNSINPSPPPYVA